MRALFVSSTCNRLTGADRDCVNIANALGPQKIRVYWAGMEGSDYLEPYFEPKVLCKSFDVGVPWFTYLVQEEAYKKRSSWLWSRIVLDHLLRLYLPLRALHREVRPSQVDIVVTTTATVTLGALYAWLYRKPHVWLVKECLDPNVRPCLHLAGLIARMSSAVVVPSQSVARPFRRPVCIFPDGNDIDEIERSANAVSRNAILERLGLPVGEPVVAQIGGIVPWKGQDVTAKAFVRLASQGVPPYFSLLFLGTGSSSYRGCVDQILTAAPPSWRGRVRFVQFDPSDFSYVSAADIVVQPSVLPDPFPNAVREAMILGKPVIGSRDGGITEMIRDGETGILFEPANSEELASAIAHLVDSPEKRAALGDASRLFARSHFDIDGRKQAFLELFRSLAAHKRCLSKNGALVTSK